jgi:hypothetical protein
LHPKPTTDTAFLSNETVLLGLRELFLKIADQSVHARSCDIIIRQRQQSANFPVIAFLAHRYMLEKATIVHFRTKFSACGQSVDRSPCVKLYLRVTFCFEIVGPLPNRRMGEDGHKWQKAILVGTVLKGLLPWLGSGRSTGTHLKSCLRKRRGGLKKLPKSSHKVARPANYFYVGRGKLKQLHTLATGLRHPDCNSRNRPYWLVCE